MAKILILGSQGFGKTTSIGKIPQLNIKGLKPEETFIISATSKPLPFQGSAKDYPITTYEGDSENLKKGRRVISRNGEEIGQIISLLSASPFKNIILDDSNYIMQDYYMANAHRKGYEIFKEIGQMMHCVFDAAELLRPDQHFIMMAHYEEFRDSSNDTISFRYKTVGKMVQDYITPEGKFEVVLFGKQSYDNQNKEVTKEFVTNFDGQYPSKSPIGMFEDLYIPNDLGFVLDKVEKYYQ